jgi:GH15 family glucan-1,4-alpha-glucosidase
MLLVGKAALVATGTGAARPPTPHVLRELSFIADGERGALLGPSGAVEWMCFPQWHDPSLFSTLIGGDGWYEVRPTSRYVWGGHYDEGTLIWLDRWVTDNGAVVDCREALALPAERETAILLRRVEVRGGECRLQLTVNPRPDYGRVSVRSWNRHTGGLFVGTAGGVHLRLSGAESASERPDGHGGRMLTCDIPLREGDQRDLVLEISTSAFDGPPVDPDRAWEQTTDEWRRRGPRLAVQAGARDARHACAVLHGLTSASGGLVAAATTSLPERADAGRNYDYRYAWMRDMSLCGLAIAEAAPDAEVLGDWTAFVRDRILEDGPKLAPAYTVNGDPLPGPTDLPLPGYPGGKVVVGNRVRDQFQLDALGETLLLFAAAAKLDRLDPDGWRAAEVAADAIAQRWQEPDSGFWELDPNWWAESRLACVAGLRTIAAAGGPKAFVAECTSLADAVMAETAKRCSHPSGRFKRAADDERVDAAMLLSLVRGAVAPDDPRVAATIAAVREELAVDGYVYRYRPDARPLGDAEGAFLMCGFAMSLAEHSQGNAVATARWFERTRSGCGPPGLFSEEFDVDERQLRGNLPQAFVHALLLEAAAVQKEQPVT